MRRKAQGNPLAAGVIAFGLGMLVSSLIPSSEKEREAVSQLQDNLEPVKEKAAEVAKDMAENLKQPAQGDGRVGQGSRHRGRRKRQATRSIGSRRRQGPSPGLKGDGAASVDLTHRRTHLHNLPSNRLSEPLQLQSPVPPGTRHHPRPVPPNTPRPRTRARRFEPGPERRCSSTRTSSPHDVANSRAVPPTCQEFT